MIDRSKWIERRFHFDAPEGWIYNVLERLHGTVPRIEALTRDLSDSQLRFKPGQAWSIKEHIGHLIDLELLHEGRIDDFEAGKSVLRAADMSNVATHSAGHNQKSLDELMNGFNVKRQQFISRLLRSYSSIRHRSAEHPRLKIPMRPIDLAIFTAEHDDHHLASIRQIIGLQDSGNR